MRFRRAEDGEVATDPVHRQDRGCCRDDTTPGSHSSSARRGTDACDPDVQKAVKLPQVQHTERVIVVQSCDHNIKTAIRTAQEKAGGSSESTARSSGRRGCGDTANVLETKPEREAWRRRYRKVLPTS